MSPAGKASTAPRPLSARGTAITEVLASTASAHASLVMKVKSVFSPPRLIGLSSGARVTPRVAMDMVCVPTGS